VGLRSRAISFEAATDPALAERLFSRIVYGPDDVPCFWLDTPTASEKMRFSFMGNAAGPHAEVLSYDVTTKTCMVTARAGAQVDAVPAESFFDFIESRINDRKCEQTDNLPFAFNGGYVGYLGYELKAECMAGGPNRHRSAVPDAVMIFADRFLAIDHLERAIYLVCILPHGDGSLDSLAREEEAWFDETERQVIELLREGHVPAHPQPETRRQGSDAVEFRLERDEAAYCDDIRTCLGKIHDGETYEICLTNRLRARCSVDPFELYRNLRHRANAPYSAFLVLPGGVQVACCSPERFLRIDQYGRVESKPIKGTRKRSPDPCEDAELRTCLEKSVKDRAENLMIVDLVRHDLSRSCVAGTVKVPHLMSIETFKTVHQMVSTVRGQLSAGISGIRCLRDAFPMGSMTGAPKIRTMQIIDDLEHSARGIYSGCIGFFALSGAVDMNVVIRSAVVRNDGVEIGVGGAIVALSDPQDEFAEILLKGHALMEAVASSITGSQHFKVGGARVAYN